MGLEPPLKKIGLPIIVLFFCAIPVYAQSGKSAGKSQVSAKIIEEEFFQGNYRKADSLLTRCGTAVACQRLKGISLYHQQKIISAENAFFEALDLVSEKNSLEEASVREWLGHLFMKKSEPGSALIHYEKALTIHKQQSSLSGYALFYLNYFIASARYLQAQLIEAKKDQPFIRIIITHLDRDIKVDQSDSLVASYISSALESLKSHPTRGYYAYSLLFTEFPNLPIKPQFYGRLLGKLDADFMDKLRSEPIGITLSAQATFWYMGYYQHLAAQYGREIPVYYQQLRVGGTIFQNSTGREQSQRAKENIQRYQKHTDLISFLNNLNQVQTMLSTQFSREYVGLLEFRNEAVDHLTQLGSQYHTLHRFVHDDWESKSKRLRDAERNNDQAKLSQLDPGLVQDLELYDTYLKQRTFFLDSLAITLIQDNLNVIGNTEVRFNKYPDLNTKGGGHSAIQAAYNTLLVKANFLFAHSSSMAVSEGDLAVKYEAFPFKIASMEGSVKSIDVSRAFNENALVAWKMYERWYDYVLSKFENTSDKLFWASQSRGYRLDALDAAMVNTPKVATTQPEIEKLNDAFFFSERMRGTAFLSELSSMKLKNGQITEGKYEHYVRPPRLLDIQNILDNSTAIIWWVTTQYNLYRFQLTKMQCRISVTSRRESKILPMIKAFRNSILYQQDDLFRDNAYKLYDQLFPSLSDEITNLIIIPEKEMWLIPFEALLTKKVGKKEIGQYQAYPFLLKRAILSYDLSLTTYWLRKQWKRPVSSDFVAFAPVFEEETKASEATVRAAQSAMEEMEEQKNRNSLVRGGQVTPLPGTRIEVALIDSLFRAKGLQSSSFLFGKAGESTVKSTFVNPSTIIHFATHGFANPHDPIGSGLIMAEEPSGKEDGTLYGSEVLLLNLNSQLIVLSACETGLGKVFPGEGSASLMRNFLLAGANNMVSSLWRVSDESTQKFMVYFYQSLLDNPHRPYSHAVAVGKKKLIAGGFPHPYYWSAFLLFGH